MQQKVSRIKDTVTKSNDQGLKQIRVDRKVVWVYPNVEEPEKYVQ